jgi:hypothetical protein
MWIGMILAVALITASGQDKPSREGEAPRQPLRQVRSFVDYAPLRSFQELCENSDAIIEGVAESAAARMMPGLMPALERVETDAWIGITRVLKDTRPGIPPIADIPRYRMYNLPFGKYPVDHGRFAWPMASLLRMTA